MTNLDNAATVSRRKVRAVRAAAAGIAVVFVVQQVVIETTGEPFPGLTLPSFAPAIQPGVIAQRVPRIEAEFADGTETRVPGRRLVGRTPGRAFDVVDTLFWVHAKNVYGTTWEP